MEWNGIIKTVVIWNTCCYQKSSKILHTHHNFACICACCETTQCTSGLGLGFTQLDWRVRNPTCDLFTISIIISLGRHNKTTHENFCTSKSQSKKTTTALTGNSAPSETIPYLTYLKVGSVTRMRSWSWSTQIRMEETWSLKVGMTTKSPPPPPLSLPTNKKADNTKFINIRSVISCSVQWSTHSTASRLVE